MRFVENERETGVEQRLTGGEMCCCCQNFKKRKVKFVGCIFV